MKIAVLGGTGNIGVGLSLRLAIAGYDVIVGSRDESKAEEKAREYESILEGLGYEKGLEYASNAEASKLCDIAILAIPCDHVFSTAESLKDSLSGKIVVSPAVPMKKEGKTFYYAPPPEGSAAEKLAAILNKSEVVSAFHTIPAKKFADLKATFSWDVPVCGEGKAKETVIDIVNSIDGLRALDAGPLSSSRLVESVTPLLINVAIRAGMRDLSIKFV